MAWTLFPYLSCRPRAIGDTRINLCLVFAKPFPELQLYGCRHSLNHSLRLSYHGGCHHGYVLPRETHHPNHALSAYGYWRYRLAISKRRWCHSLLCWHNDSLSIISLLCHLYRSHQQNSSPRHGNAKGHILCGALRLVPLCWSHPYLWRIAGTSI